MNSQFGIIKTVYIFFVCLRIHQIKIKKNPLTMELFKVINRYFQFSPLCLENFVQLNIKNINFFDFP